MDAPRRQLGPAVINGAPVVGAPVMEVVAMTATVDEDGPTSETVLAPRVQEVCARTTVSLVIPVKNEARNLAWVLSHIPPCVDEVVLVDGESVDASAVMAMNCRPDVRLITQSGPGKGTALRTGFEACRGDVVVMIDADGSMSPEEIPHYLHFLANGYDFVKGSRFVGGGGSLDITRFRRAGNRALLAVMNSLYDVNLTDLCYGFCAFDRRFLEHLRLSASGFEIEAQMTVHAVQAGLRIAEVPSLELPRRSGRSNLHAVRDGRRVLSTLLADHPGRIARVARRTHLIRDESSG